MKPEDLKIKIGNKARDIIVSECGLEFKSGYYSCPATKHNNDTHSTRYFDDTYHFWCYDCKKGYDICNHANTKPNKYEYLMELAGEKYKPKKFNILKPVINKIQNRGISYLKSRGISEKTIKDYKVTSDDNFIYFNYATPPPKPQLVKIKKRRIDSKRFVAERGGSEIFYGMHLLKNQNTLLLCEGECDCLALYEIVSKLGWQDKMLCSSLPNGANSLSDVCIDNCKDWLDRFERIIIIPDQDEAGKQFIDDALEKLDEYTLAIINLPVNDVNEYLLQAETPTEIFKLATELIPDLNGIIKSSEVQPVKIANGIASGYITHDNNDNGLKEGCLTIITGKTGDGKTSYSRQILITAAMQGTYSFMFVGETSVEKEVNKLARLCAEQNEIALHDSCAGGVRYQASMQALERYKKHFGEKIFMSDKTKIKSNDKLFPKVLTQMKNMAKHYKVKLFIMDNLMVFCQKPGNQVFAEQKQIVESLKSFAEEYSAHVILIAHPKKGDGEQSISGATEIQNESDTILRYIRIDDDEKSSLFKKFAPIKDTIERASAYIKTEKVRDDGHRKIAWLEWDGKRGALYDLSNLPMAEVYENRGYWTRKIN